MRRQATRGLSEHTIYRGDICSIAKHQKARPEGIIPKIPLPCLNSNISNETSPQDGRGEAEAGALPAYAPLSTTHRKSAFILKESVQLLAETHGLENLGFLTLTFRDHVINPAPAQKRLNSLITGVFKKRYKGYVGVVER